jgi:hypothetical protein
MRGLWLPWGCFGIPSSLPEMLESLSAGLLVKRCNGIGVWDSYPDSAGSAEMVLSGPALDLPSTYTWGQDGIGLTGPRKQYALTLWWEGVIRICTDAASCSCIGSVWDETHLTHLYSPGPTGPHLDLPALPCIRPGSLDPARTLLHPIVLTGINLNALERARTDLNLLELSGTH